jgi:3-dehydroquinate synthase
VTRTVRLLDYEITVDAGALDRVGAIARTVAPAHRYAIISDETVAPLYADRVRRTLGEAVLATIPAGEQFKTREHWADLSDALLAAGCGRDAVVIALGGGVVGDVAGFVAATFMRGIPFIQVPTTLLAMVDASVGGKTGVDTPHGKNLIGAFHQPRAVIIDPLVLESLPDAQRRAGLAEVVKHGAIADASHLADAVAVGGAFARGGHADDALAALIARSVEIKASVVSVDEREKGLRQVLNFGHTVGHAVEAASQYRLLHGEAIAIGMVAEARVGEVAGMTSPEVAGALESGLESIGLPTRIPAELGDTDVLFSYMHADKKARRGRLAFAVPHRIGEMAGAASGWAVEVDDATVRRVLAERWK